MRQYYIHHDFYHYKNDDTLTIISHFPTYLQTTPSTCGPCCALMVLKYFGIDMGEMEISKKYPARYQVGQKFETYRTFSSSTVLKSFQKEICNEKKIKLFLRWKNLNHLS